MIDTAELKCCSIFDDLNERELEEVAKLGTVEKWGAGARVIAEGTNAGALYMLAEGRVVVRMTSRDGNEVVVDELGPGNVFGWSAVLDDQMFKANIWALEDSTIILLDGEKLRQLLYANNHIGFRVTKAIAGITASRLEKLRSRLVDQPFSRAYLVPARSSPVATTGPQSEMRAMGCPECSTANRPFAIVNETEQYRCKKCGMIYYSPVGCETGVVTPSSERAPDTAARLGENWSASIPSGD
jgi:CRP/FNR family transcriptional regulator, cyclic AMP receptor protein